MNSRHLLPLIVAVSSLCASSLALAGPGREFRAEYEVLVDGKPRLESRIEMTRQDSSWTMESEGHGTRGLARMLGVRTNEVSRVEWSGERFRPLEFHYHSRVAGRDEKWSADFDHAAAKVQLQHEDGTASFPTAPGTWDPLSLTLELRRRLAAGETDFEVQVADEDEIDTHRYRAGANSFIKTAIGCMAVIELERVRENSKRYSRAWYAVDHDYLPVRVQHGKQGGKDFDMRIMDLKVGNQAVKSEQSCAR